MPGGEHYELIHGMPVEKPTGAESDEVALALGGKLRAYVIGNKLGRVYGAQTGYKKCFPHAPTLLRKPDVSFVAEARLPNGQTPRGDLSIAPDLAAEVISPNDTYEEVEEKVIDIRQAWGETDLGLQSDYENHPHPSARSHLHRTRRNRHTLR
jgi:Uma2 family endonuclease